MIKLTYTDRQTDIPHDMIDPQVDPLWILIGPTTYNGGGPKTLNLKAKKIMRKNEPISQGGWKTRTIVVRQLKKKNLCVLTIRISLYIYNLTGKPQFSEL